MKKHPKKLTLMIIGAVSVVTLTLAVGITLAYLGHQNEKTNTIKVGYGDVELSEEGFSEPSELSMVSPDMDKKVTVKNTSTVPAFVRVYAEFTDSELAEHAKVKYKKSTDNTQTDEMLWSAFKDALNNNKAGGTFDSDWRYVPEEDSSGLGGYFYYTKALDAGKITSALFDSVKIDYQRYDDENTVQDSSNTDRIVPLEMIVYSELVQTVETGEYVSGTTSEYGHDYNTDTDDAWESAWKSFLKTPPASP